MLNRLIPAFVLLTALALAAPALANDFIAPSPVPSSRDKIKPATKTQQAPVSWQNLQAPNKIVKTTKKPTGQINPANPQGAGVQ
ncbi:hypothetical protein [Humidesulfovibrio idahonensis]